MERMLTLRTDNCLRVFMYCVLGILFMENILLIRLFMKIKGVTLELLLNFTRNLETNGLM